MNALITSLQPLLQTILEIALPILLAMAYAKFHALTGITIEANQREALQSALANAAKLVVAGGTLQDGIDYVTQSVPDALKGLGVDVETALEDLLKPHVAAASQAASTNGIATTIAPIVK